MILHYGYRVTIILALVLAEGTHGRNGRRSASTHVGGLDYERATCDRDTDVYRAQFRTRATTKSTIFLGKSELGFIYLL